MKSILEKATRDELITRIHSLQENSAAQWGKMSVAQMIKHCSQWDEMALGKKQFKRIFIGRLFGRIALKDMMQDKPIKKDLPSVPSFIMKVHPDFAEEKTKWLTLMNEYKDLSDDGFSHPFFGHLTKEQTGIMVYKHVDHHLRQFNS